MTKTHTQQRESMEAIFEWDENDVGTEPEILEHVRYMKSYLEQMEHLCVKHMRQDGASWAAVGEALGMSRQAAHEKWRSVDLRFDLTHA